MLRVSQVASRLNLSASKVYQLIERGQLSHYRLGASIRISEEQLTAYLMETERRRSVPERPRARHRPRLRHISLQ